MKLMTRVDGLWAIVPLPLSSNSRILIDFLTDNYVLENKNIANLCIDYNGQMIPLLHENEIRIVAQLIAASSMDPNITQKWVSFLYLTQTHISISKISTIEYEIDDVRKLAKLIDRELCRQITQNISERDKLHNAALVNMLASEVCDVGTALTITYVLNDGVLVYENLGSNHPGSNDSNDETVHGFHVRGHVKPGEKESVIDSKIPETSLGSERSERSERSETLLNVGSTDDLSAFERELADLEIGEIKD